MEAGAAQRERPLKVALVHDFLLDLRGAERVFLAMCDVWPDADIYTAVYDEQGTEGRFSHRRVYTSFLQRLHVSSQSFRPLLPLYPAAIESFELSGYDVVVSSSSAWAHAVICDDHTVHVCYCHNPFRYAWNDRDRTLAARDPVTRGLLSLIFRRWREWDCVAAERVDRYLTNSKTTQARIRAYFGREAAIVHPPVETRRFRPGPVGDHYLVLSELMPHKRIDTAIEAFNRLGRPLVVAGDGPDSRRLRRLAGPNVTFAGRVSDAEVERLLSTSRALVLTAVEEFGIAAVEAQAAGRPVVALRGGGALETIQDGVTGCFWSGGADDLVDAVEGFDDGAVDPVACVENARRFDVEQFKEALPREVRRTMEAARTNPPRPDRPMLMMTRFARAALPGRDPGPGREQGQRPAQVG